MIDIEITKDELEGLTSKKDFGNDIIIGEVGENLFKRYLVNHKGLTFIRKSEDKKELKKWDLELLFKNKNVRYEVKTDVYILPGKWIFHLDEIWIIPVDKLRQLINSNEFPISEESGDINSHTKGYLIPREEFRKHFKVIKYQKVIV